MAAKAMMARTMTITPVASILMMITDSMGPVSPTLKIAVETRPGRASEEQR